jgi:hypothetical protein
MLSRMTYLPKKTSSYDTKVCHITESRHCDSKTQLVHDTQFSSLVFVCHLPLCIFPKNTAEKHTTYEHQEESFIIERI